MIDAKKFSRFLDEIAEALDIPPGKYRDAVDRYRAVGEWLETGECPLCRDVPAIYSQGSFRLGTVVRPIRDGKEADYDIDLVSEFPIAKSSTTAGAVKAMAGDRLRENAVYRKMLDPEGKRCWTLKYAEEDGVGFHLDILPAVLSPSQNRLGETSIAITNKEQGVYSWSASNPRGYGQWFDERNRAALARVRAEQQRMIQKRAPDIYARIEDVPDALIRTPLQRSIQIAKRHRDVCFNNDAHRYAPISIIITTLFAQLYGGEVDVYSALRGIVLKLAMFSGLVKHEAVDPGLEFRDLIQRTPQNGWYIGNPADPDENFADRWHEDGHARAKAFFYWIGKLQEDCIDILNERNASEVRKRLTSVFGASVAVPHLGAIFSPGTSRSPAPKIRIENPGRPWGTK